MFQKIKVKIQKNLHRQVIKGPSLQNKSCDILIRTRFRPVILCTDIEKAFLQIRIKAKERESLKFRWVENLTNSTIQILRFTRLEFGSNQSPFILEGTLKMHFEKCESMYLELIRKMRNDMYVDDLLTGKESLIPQNYLKKGSLNFPEGTRMNQIYRPTILALKKELNFAKEHLETKANETKILGLSWDKQRNTFRGEIPIESQRLAKRNILKILASIYDSLGFILPVLLIGKILFRNLCDSRIP